MPNSTTCPAPYLACINAVLPAICFSPNNQPEARTPFSTYFATDSSSVSQAGLDSDQIAISSGSPLVSGSRGPSFTLSSEPGEQNSSGGTPDTTFRALNPSLSTAYWLARFR